MARETAEAFIKRADKAKTEMDINRGMFEDAYEYLMPFRNIWSNAASAQSHNKPTKQYDSTAMIAANNFVNTMQNSFTPVFQRWAELRAGSGVPEDQKAAYNKILQSISDMLYSYRNASNFYTATAEGYFDLGVGTMVMFILKGDRIKPFNYVPIPLAQVSLEDGKYGEVCGVYRRHKMKGRFIKATWPKAKIPESIAKIMRDEPDKEIEIVEGFYYDYDAFIWYQDVVTCTEGKESLFQDEFKEAPFVAPRWMRIPGFATGIGPFLMAMADYKTLNKMKEMMLTMAALNVFGAYTVRNNGTFNPNTIQIRPGAFIPVEQNGTQNPSIAALPRAGDFQAQEYMVKDLQDQIRQVMLDNRLPPEDAPVRTAYEIAERIKKLQTNIGAAFGRLVYEFVIPLHRREISIMADLGLIQVPDWFEIDNLTTEVQVVSPIARAQGAEDVSAFTNAFQITAGISPEMALLTYDVERAGAWIGEQLGVDADLIRDEETRGQLQKMAAQLIAQMQMAQQQQAVAQ